MTALTTYNMTQCQQCEVCPSYSVAIVQTSVITAIVTAILVTVVFVVAIIAVCKFHPKYRSGRDKVLTGEEEQVYEREMGGDGGGVAVVGGKEVSGPTYMEVGEGGGKIFQLKENEAYGTRR